MDVCKHTESGEPDVTAAATALLGVIQELVAELHPHLPSVPMAAMDSSLDRDLGFDSLGRLELLCRIERTFRISLPEQAFSVSETPRDLLRAVRRAASAVTATTVGKAPRIMPTETETFPHHALTLVDVLEWHADAHPERLHIQFFEDRDEGEQITYRQLKEQAEAVANGLQQDGLQPEETVVLMLPTGNDYFFSFFGVLLAGGIPVPVYPPLRKSQIEDHLRRQQGILENCQAAVLITIPEARHVAQLLKTRIETLRQVVTVAELLVRQGRLTKAALNPGDIAFLQYTSGSTGNPKGVILTHANLLANIRAAGAAIQADSTDVFVSWLPLYHDMGLIGAWLGSLYHAVLLVIMSPLAFLTRPQRWLQAIHRYHATLSAAPNFAYELCLKKIADQDLAGLDLGSWRVAFNGAEAVSPQTVQRFSERFRSCGFLPVAMYPVYGLAECALGLCFPPLNRSPRTDVIQREPFQQTGQALPADATDKAVLCFVACGHPLPGYQVRVTGPTGRELPERREGRLEFCGPSATSGYYRNPEATQSLFHDEWLDSGDLAYTAAGDVYITGRAKDIIIRAGRHIYPDELEAAIGELPGIRKGCVVVFGSVDPSRGTERLIVLAELRESDVAAADSLRRQINGIATELTGGAPSEIVLAPPHTVMKTSSGKLRRTATRALYEKGKLLQRGHAVWWQVVHFALAGTLPWLRRTRHLLASELYAGYTWMMFGLLGSLAWLAVVVLPRKSWRWLCLHGAAQMFVRSTGIPLRVRGMQNLPQADHPCVMVANHSSYLDVVAVAAALPRPVGYVSKAELARHFGSRLFLNRLGAQFVERYDRQKGIADARKLASVARAGQPLIFFPEGTITRMPGLLPFHMGAFVAAVEAGVPVVPIAIRGTRSILRADTWFPHRGTITITIGAPLPAEKDEDKPSTQWEAAMKLRDNTREFMLRYCGEPDLVQMNMRNRMSGPPSIVR